VTAAPKPPHISIVIPVHNEAEILESEVYTLLRGLDARSMDYELILAENGSSDRTKAISNDIAERSPRVRAIHLPNPDYGAAMRAGLLEAKGALVINFDIDYHNVDVITQADPLLAEAGIVVGSKLHASSDDRRSQLRKLISHTFTLILRILFDSKIDDTHGIKVFRRDVVDRFVPETVMNEDLFDTELVIRARRAGIRVQSVPVRVEERRASRSSILRRIPRTMLGLIRLRILLWKEKKK